MIEAGALTAAFAVGLALVWTVGRSRVAADLCAIAGAREQQRGNARRVSTVAASLGGGRAVALRSGLACGAVGLLLAAGFSLLAPAGAYLAFLAPGLVADRRAARSMREAERALVVAVEWIDALVSAGRPAELAVLAVAKEGTGSSRLDLALRSASAAAALGAPVFRVLAFEARAAGLASLARIGDELERSRDLGRGSRAVLTDARDALRRQERTRIIDAASRVDAKLMLVLVLCYLPALMLIVVVPLFVGLLSGILE